MHDSPILTPNAADNDPSFQSENEWYLEFIDVDREICFTLVDASKVLKLKSLENLACAKITELMTGKPIKSMRGFFEFVACSNNAA